MVYKIPESSLLKPVDELKVQLEDAAILASQLGFDNVDLMITEAYKAIPSEDE